MSVIEHQYLHYRNVLYFEMQFDYEEVESFVKKIDYGLEILDLSRNGSSSKIPLYWVLYSCR